MSENRTRFRLDQRRAPIYEALEQFRQMRVVPFDVPGHKRGRGNPELTAFLGQQCVGVDVNSMNPASLVNPVLPPFTSTPGASLPYILEYIVLVSGIPSGCCSVALVLY